SFVVRRSTGMAEIYQHLGTSRKTQLPWACCGLPRKFGWGECGMRSTLSTSFQFHLDCRPDRASLTDSGSIDPGNHFLYAVGGRSSLRDTRPFPRQQCWFTMGILLCSLTRASWNPCDDAHEIRQFDSE